MNNGTKIGLGVLGAGAVAAIAYYLYNKNNSPRITETVTTTTTQTLLPSNAVTTSSTPQASATPGVVWAPSMTMWKDKDGNIFKLKTTEYGKWGYWIDVNGSTPKKGSMMEVMFLGPDGYVYGADNNGTFHVWQNNGWQQVQFKDNKSGLSDYLQKLGIPYGTDGRVKLNGLSGLRGLAGIGNAYALT